MENTNITKNQEAQLLSRFRYLNEVQQREALDFLGFLLTKKEWNPNFEVSEDKELLESFQRGLDDVENNRVEPLEL